jgi:type II secretory pathway pseudopilin PulG
MTSRRINSIRAFTLLESLLASSLLATAVIGIIVPFVAGAQNQREDARRTLATNLAQELMEEILTKNFSDAGGMGHESNETSRSLYDCINDYNTYTEASGQITNNCGNKVTDPAATGLSRTVSVSYTATAPIFACIVVEVKYYGTSVAKLTRLVLQP